jgi:hypothetical protein
VGQPTDVVGEYGVAVALVERFDVGMASSASEVSDPPVDLPIHDLLIQARGKEFPIVLTSHENRPVPIDSRARRCPGSPQTMLPRPAPGLRPI